MSEPFSIDDVVRPGLPLDEETRAATAAPDSDAVEQAVRRAELQAKEEIAAIKRRSKEEIAAIRRGETIGQPSQVPPAPPAGGQPSTPPATVKDVVNDASKYLDYLNAKIDSFTQQQQADLNARNHSAAVLAAAAESVQPAPDPAKQAAIRRLFGRR